MQFKFEIEQEIENVAEILNEKHLELLELMFPGWSKKFENIKSKIFKNNVTRVQINFRWKVRNRYSKFEINIKVCEHYLLFSLRTNKWLDDIFEKDFDVFKLSSYLESLGIEVEVLSVSSHKPKNGTNGQQYTEPNHHKHGKGKLPRRIKKIKGLSRKQKKELANKK